ncbi:MAG: response regulator transcription factor [Verrucomicrobiota bacterium]|jgi:DNA-binding NarL/FixJ family response regulator
MEQRIPIDFSEPLADSAADGRAHNAPGSVRVWLVDDNEQLRTTLAELLDRIGGIECSRHFSSPDALLSTLASQRGPDVILLDVQMGRHNGLDAVRPIKSLTRSTRVLMFTSCFNQEFRERALGDGASDYLLKSQTLDYIAARIRNPAGDPEPRPMCRRRASCRSEAAPQKEPASLTRRVSRLVRRTLCAFRLL